MLYPILTETRNMIDLNGIWNFKLDSGQGFQDDWQQEKLKIPYAWLCLLHIMTLE